MSNGMAYIWANILGGWSKGVAILPFGVAMTTPGPPRSAPGDESGDVMMEIILIIMFCEEHVQSLTDVKNGQPYRGGAIGGGGSCSFHFL